MSWILWSVSLSVAMTVLVFIARWYIAAERARAIRVAESTNRGLFRFSDGVKVRSIDPIAVLLDMEAHDKYRFDIHPQLVLDGDKEAQVITVDAVRGAFRVGPFIEPGKPGLSFEECLKLWNSFCWFVDNQKKNSEQPRTWPPSTEPISNESGIPTTSVMWDSGLTEGEQAQSLPSQ